MDCLIPGSCTAYEVYLTMITLDSRRLERHGQNTAQQTFVMEEISDFKDIVQRLEETTWQIAAFGSHGVVTLK